MPSLRLSPMRLSSLGSRRGGGGTPAPVTNSFTFAQGSPGLAGDLNKVTNADRWSGFFARTVWAGYITGSAAYMTTRNHYGNTGQIRVTVDGTSSTPSQTGNEYTLFSGLADTAHFVVVAVMCASDDQYFLFTDNMFRVTGVAPLLAPFTTFRSWGQNTADFLSNIASINRPNGYLKPGADFVPSIWSAGGGNSTWEQNNGAVAFKTDASEILFTTANSNASASVASSATIAVSIDGGAPSFYTATGIKMFSYKLGGLSGTHTYNVWTNLSGGNVASPVPLIVSLKDGSFQSLSLPKFDQFGTSITSARTTGVDAHNSEVFGVASNLNYVGQNHGKSGETILGLKTKIDALLANKTVGASDVCVLEIGENDVPTTSLDATKTTNYQYIVSALLTKGYRRVICRAPITDAYAGSQRAMANSIQSIVSGYADARVQFCPVNTWSGITTLDGLHPNAAGYLTMRGYAIAAYPALLA